MSDYIIIIESINKIFSQYIITILHILESYLFRINLKLIDILSISDQLAKSTNISQTDVYEIIDVLSSFVYIEQCNDDTVNMIESLLLNVGLSKTDILELIESYSRTSEHKRILSDVAIINETRATALIHLQSDIFNFVEYIIQTRGIMISDIFDITETEKIDSSKKLLATVVVAEQLQRQIGFSREDAIEIIALLVSSSVFYKDVIDSIVVIESMSKENSLTNTEIFALVDSFSRVSAYAKIFDEHTIFSETLQKDIVFKPVDSLTFVDFIKFTRTFHLVDTSSLSDLILLSPTLSQLDILNISDDLNRQFTKDNADAVDIAETQARVFAANRVFTDSLILDDELSFAEYHLLADMLTIQELIIHSCDFATTDTLVIVGEISKKDKIKSISDEFITSEDLTKSISLYIIDTEELIDDFSKISNFDLSEDDIASIEDHFKVDRYERMKKNKTLLVSTSSKNKVYLFHSMRK